MLNSRVFQGIVIVCLISPWVGAAEPVPVQWLDGQAPSITTGVSWGVPWSKGTVQPDQDFTLTTVSGESLPVQTWPLAYWPDGSLKWSGMAFVADSHSTGPLQLTLRQDAVSSRRGLRVIKSDTTVLVDTGVLRTRIRTWGGALIESMVVGGREVARNGRLVCVLQDGPDGDASDTPARESYDSRVVTVTVEQRGPVQAVIKIEGNHKGLRTARQWLPFTVRLYFYAGSSQVRMVHSVVYDGDQFRDFIRGLGVVFDVPMREEIQNRHVRFSGQDNGLWAEPIQPLKGRDRRIVSDPKTRGDVYSNQIAGLRVPSRADLDERSQGWLADWAIWDDFKLVQPNAEGFTIVKRTNAASAWLPAGAGQRASGLVFAGDVSGGLAVSLKNFWQSYPASLEVSHASQSQAELRVWFWSPDGPTMDMRHYDTKPHGLEAVYEDVQPGLSTPFGVARTSELTLFATDGVPSKEQTAQMAGIGARPPVAMCSPKYLHAVKAFGFWGLKDRSTPFKAAIEDRLDSVLDTYLKAVDQFKWYGFWDFGDVMHSYDRDRHVWRYDLGGMAWDNSELGTDMWLWVSFLRSGRADIFRLAEAMTRHTGEVDSYHIGPLAGLGSRHNVRHWGCGAKEARISQAGYRRYYYYLTTDERTGDIMREMLQADDRLIEYDPMRIAQPRTEAETKYPTRLRLGPDWLALASNWMTEWERTRNTVWRDKIYTGMDCLCKMPLGLRTGKNLVMGYDPATSELFQLDDQAGTYNLATIMGGAEVVFELNMMVDHPGWQKAWLQYCRLYSAPKDIVEADMTTGKEGLDARYVRDARLAAYVYQQTGEQAFLEYVLRGLGRSSRGRGGSTSPNIVSGPLVLNPIEEGPGMGTNGAAQDGLTTMAALGMVGDHLPDEAPAFTPPQGRGRRPGQ